METTNKIFYAEGESIISFNTLEVNSRSKCVVQNLTFFYRKIVLARILVSYKKSVFDYKLRVIVSEENTYKYQLRIINLKIEISNCIFYR